MSVLLRLLTTGKSLVGLKDQVHRYRLGTQGLLPKFGPARNPFQEPADGARGDGREIPRSEAGMGSEKGGNGPRGEEPATSKGLRGLGNWFAGKPVVSGKRGGPPVTPPLQYELSLERVQVVRNDLSDTDLEIVARKLPKPKGVTVVAAPSGTFGRVPTQMARATTRLLEALKT